MTYKKLTASDVPKEWQQAVKDRAKDQGVDEDSVIRHGLRWDFKEETEKKEVKDSQKALKSEMKEVNKTLQDILKELKK